VQWWRKTSAHTSAKSNINTQNAAKSLAAEALESLTVSRDGRITEKVSEGRRKEGTKGRRRVCRRTRGGKKKEVKAR